MSSQCSKAQWIAIAMMLVTFACGSPRLPPPALAPKPQENTPKNVIKQSAKISAPPAACAPQEYITDLSLAMLAFQENPANIAHAWPLLHRVEEDARYISSPTLQPIIILHYKHKDGVFLSIAAPFSMPRKDDSFPCVERVLSAVHKDGYVLDDVQTLVLNIPAGEPLRFEGDDGARVQKKIESRLAYVLGKGTPLTRAAEVKVQLELSRFFMARRERDGAWLTLENAKQGIVPLLEGKTVPQAEVDQLTREAEEQEDTLHKTLPFTLGF